MPIVALKALLTCIFILQHHVAPIEVLSNKIPVAPWIKAENTCWVLDLMDFISAKRQCNKLIGNYVGYVPGGLLLQWQRDRQSAWVGLCVCDNLQTPVVLLHACHQRIYLTALGDDRS